MITRQEQIEQESAALRRFQLAADEICHLIRKSGVCEQEVDVRIQALTEQARRLFPQKMDLYTAIYLRRFERLRDEWKSKA